MPSRKDQQRVQHNHRDRFGAYVVGVTRIQSIHERSGGAIEFEVLAAQHERHHEDHDICEHGDEPVEAGQDAIQLQAFPIRCSPSKYRSNASSSERLRR